MERATFAAGCFWGVEATFARYAGVLNTTVGYMGGTLADPTYEEVRAGGTGHAEVVQVLYDPGRISYEQLLMVFWTCHDPTTLNKQGPDEGTQYRSGIYWHSHAQKHAAEKSRREQELSGRFKAPIVTEVLEASEFYKAEEYHQRYLEKRGLAFCH